MRRFTQTLLILALLSLSGIVSGQALQRISHVAMEVSWGSHQIIPHRTGDDMDLKASSRGVALGYVVGNNLLKTRLRGLGIYLSEDRYARPYIQYEGEMLINFYPLEFFRTRKNVIDIYILTGVNFTRVQRAEDTFPTRHASSISQVAGVGLEYLVRNDSRFAHLFIETSFASTIFRTDAFETVHRPLPPLTTAVNFGIRFGQRKLQRPRPVPY